MSPPRWVRRAFFYPILSAAFWLTGLMMVYAFNFQLWLSFKCSFLSPTTASIVALSIFAPHIVLKTMTFELQLDRDQEAWDQMISHIQAMKDEARSYLQYARDARLRGDRPEAARLLYCAGFARRDALDALRDEALWISTEDAWATHSHSPYAT